MKVDHLVNLKQPDGRLETVKILLKYRGGLFRVARLDNKDKPIKSSVMVVRKVDLTPLL